METLVIRNPSLGGYSIDLQEAILSGFRVSLKPSEYPHLDNQFNAVLERCVDVLQSNNEQSLCGIQQEEPIKKSAGRPRRESMK